uniref:PDZ domain-containing protein n=1 Tax=Sus scrofa TaxID=9823 RepID=A0A8D1BM89_PIG
MEKEEETTRELLLPNWQGSGSHGLTIAQRDDGVYVQEVMQNSPAARTGVVKEGDQIVGATIYFDNLQSGEVTQLLNTMGHHTVGLKLHRKGDRSPEPGQTWTHEVFSSHSSEVVLVSGPPMAGPSPSLCPLDLDSPSPSCSHPPLSVEPVWFLLFCVAADAAPTSFLSLSFGGAPAWGPTPAVWSQMPEGESAALQGSLT